MTKVSKSFLSYLSSTPGPRVTVKADAACSARAYKRVCFCRCREFCPATSCVHVSKHTKHLKDPGWGFLFCLFVLSLSLPLCLLITYCNLNEKEKMNRHDKRILTAASTAAVRLFSLLLNYDVTEMNRSQSHYANLIAVIEWPDLKQTKKSRGLTGLLA